MTRNTFIFLKLEKKIISSWVLHFSETEFGETATLTDAGLFVTILIFGSWEQNAMCRADKKKQWKKWTEKEEEYENEKKTQGALQMIDNEIWNIVIREQQLLLLAVSWCQTRMEICFEIQNRCHITTTATTASSFLLAISVTFNNSRFETMSSSWTSSVNVNHETQDDF